MALPRYPMHLMRLGRPKILSVLQSAAFAADCFCAFALAPKPYGQASQAKPFCLAKPIGAKVVWNPQPTYTYTVLFQGLKPMKYPIFLTTICAGVLAIGGCTQRTSFDYYLRSQLEAQRGHMDAAMAALSVAIEKNPELGLAYVSRGEIYKSRGNYVDAARDFEKATKIEPYNFDAHFQLGLMYQYLKRFNDAIGAYQKAVGIRPLDPDANMNLALTYSQVGDAQKGLPYAQHAVENAPGSATAHANLGTLYGLLGYSALAIAEFKKSIELDSKQPEVYVNLGEEYLRLGKWEQARQVLEDGKEFGPGPAVSERLGLAYYKLGNLDKAADAYQDALRQAPSYYQAMNGLGVVHMTRSLQTSPADVAQAQEALDQWNKSLQAEPNQPVIRQLVTRFGGPTTTPAATQHAS